MRFLRTGPYRTGIVFSVIIAAQGGIFLSIERKRMDNHMNITLGLAPLISLIAGILILVMPRLLNYIVAIYLIVIGLIGLFGAGNFHL